MSQTLSTAALLAVPLAFLAGCLAAGILGTAFGGNVIGRRASHTATDRKSTRLNSSHLLISYAVFCLKKKH